MKVAPRRKAHADCRGNGDRILAAPDGKLFREAGSNVRPHQSVLLLTHNPGAPEFPGSDLGRPNFTVEGRSKLEIAIDAAKAAMPYLAICLEEAEEASHEPLFHAYDLLKDFHQNPHCLAWWLEKAGVPFRKDTPFAKRVLRLVLHQIASQKPKQTEHDWSDWLSFMHRDGITVSLDAVKAYLTDYVDLGGGSVRGQTRLDALRKQRREIARCDREATRMERAAEKESDMAAALKRPLGHIEPADQKNQIFAGRCLIYAEDGVIAGVLNADAKLITSLITKHGFRS